MVIRSTKFFIAKHSGQQATPYCRQVLARAGIVTIRPGPVFRISVSVQQDAAPPVIRIRPAGSLCRKKEYGVPKARGVTTRR
jgi:hypothetical protein